MTQQNGISSEAHPDICPIFQERFFHHFPQWAGETHLEHMKKLYNLAAAITLKKDSSSIWGMLESNPFLMMYFGYQIERMQPMGLGKNGRIGVIISGLLFVLGGLWSLHINKMDPTLMHIVSLFMGGLGAVVKDHGQKFFHKRRKNGATYQAPVEGNE